MTRSTRRFVRGSKKRPANDQRSNDRPSNDRQERQEKGGEKKRRKANRSEVDPSAILRAFHIWAKQARPGDAEPPRDYFERFRKNVILSDPEQKATAQLESGRFWVDSQGDKHVWHYYDRGLLLEELLATPIAGCLPNPDDFWRDDDMLSTQEWTFMPQTSEDPLYKLGSITSYSLQTSAMWWAQRLGIHTNVGPSSRSETGWRAYRDDLIRRYLATSYVHPITKQHVVL